MVFEVAFSDVNDHHHILQKLLTRVLGSSIEPFVLVKNHCMVVMSVQTGSDVLVSFHLQGLLLHFLAFLESINVVKVGIVPVLLLEVSFELFRMNVLFSELIVVDSRYLIG